MKQTAVEWLVEHLNLDETSPNYNELIINKAKKMEKEQMEKTWVAGLYCETGDRQAFIDYYNETFKSE
jgi:hypothetical protein